eukprot:2745761-Pyramimonas_sp.AAC.1
MGKAEFVKTPEEVDHSSGKFLFRTEDDLDDDLRDPILVSRFYKRHIHEIDLEYSDEEALRVPNNLSEID